MILNPCSCTTSQPKHTVASEANCLFDGMHEKWNEQQKNGVRLLFARTKNANQVKSAIEIQSHRIELKCYKLNVWFVVNRNCERIPTFQLGVTRDLKWKQTEYIALECSIYLFLNADQCWVFGKKVRWQNVFIKMHNWRLKTVLFIWCKHI